MTDSVRSFDGANLRVLHAATHDHNIGDGALVAGMHATLSEDLALSLAITPIDVLGCKLRKQRDMLPAAQWPQLSRGLDLVLVGGGGMIEGRIGSYKSGINFNFDLSLLERSEVPWVFYALGFNQFRRSVFFHRRRLERLLAIAERRNMPFTVRNDGSKARLERLVGPLPFVRTIPDPGLYVPARRRNLPELASDRPNIVVQLAGDQLGKRFGGTARRAWRSSLGRDPLTSLARVLASVTNRHRVRIVFCPHLLTDLGLVSEVVSRLPNRVMREHCTSAGVLKGATAAPDFFDLYRQADLVIGMRGHSAICAVGAGTPFIGLGSHDKIGGFLEEIGMPDALVDLDSDPHLKRLDELIDVVLSAPGQARNRVQALLPGLRDATRQFHREIARRIGI